MSGTDTTRRAVLGAISSVPATIMVAGPALAEPTDAGIIAAWNVRQQALAEIERRGTFFKCETESPELATIYDEAEMRIVRTNAYTPRGALIQAWVALSHCGHGDTATAAMARRADWAGIEPLIVAELDFDQECVAQTIRTLRYLVGEA